jgi:hypothetical protein
LRGGPPPEEPAVGRQPPFTGALALTFIPGEPFIDRVQRSSPNSVVRQIARGQLAPSSKTT